MEALVTKLKGSNIKRVEVREERYLPISHILNNRNTPGARSDPEQKYICPVLVSDRLRTFIINVRKQS